MKHSFLFFGRAEVRILIVLALLIASGFLLLGAKGSKQGEDLERDKLSVASDTIYRSADYAGPPEHLQRREIRKFARGTIVDLNGADSATLMRVPGIGPAFARRIVRLRERLGGFYTVLQLQEVYGMDEDKFLELKPWFKIQTPHRSYYLDSLRSEMLPEHPYLNYRHKRALRRLISRQGSVRAWSSLMRDPAFSRDDSIRLSHYLIER